MITLTINGKPQRFDGDPEMPLLWVLRDEGISKARSSGAAWDFAAPVRFTLTASLPARA